MKTLKSTGLYLLAAGLIFILAFAKQGNGLKPKEFSEKIKATPTAQIVDVRTPEEYGDGYIAGAVNINWNDDNFSRKILNLDKDKPTFVYCHSGRRSSDAAEKMRSMGFTEVYELSGGITNWHSASLPVMAGKGNETGMSMASYQQLLVDKRPVLVEIYAKWCSPCKKMAPYLERLTNSEAEWLKIVSINADKNIALGDQLKVTGLPTLFLYRNGEKIWEHAGYISETDLIAEIKKAGK